jgi:hypothetical protein
MGKQVDQEKAAVNNYFFLTARYSSMQSAIRGRISYGPGKKPILFGHIADLFWQGARDQSPE